MSEQKSEKVRIPWACPKCGAKADSHGKGGAEECIAVGDVCQGFICECECESADVEDHGETFDNPCPCAHCYHCGWEGRVPRKPKGLQAWERTALDAGWEPPAARRKELGLDGKGAA